MDEASEAASRQDGRRKDTRFRIMKIALDLFVQRGFLHASLQDIADELSLTKTALYYHFDSKSALVNSVVLPAIEAVDALLRAQSDTPPSTEFLSSYFDLMDGHRSVFLALIRDPVGFAYVSPEGSAAEWMDRVVDYLAGSNPTPKQRLRAIASVRVLNESVVQPDMPLGSRREAALEIAAKIMDWDRPEQGSK